MPDADATALIYDEAIRGLDQQRAALSELRNRASTLIATAAIAISLLDARAFHDSGAPFAWAAFAAFGLLGGCVLVVLWPRAELGAPLSPTRLVSVLTSTERTSDEEASPDIRTDLLTYMGVHHDANSATIKTVAQAFRVGSLCLVIEISCTVATRLIGA